MQPVSVYGHHATLAPHALSIRTKMTLPSFWQPGRNCLGPVARCGGGTLPSERAGPGLPCRRRRFPQPDGNVKLEVYPSNDADFLAMMPLWSRRQDLPARRGAGPAARRGADLHPGAAAGALQPGAPHDINANHRFKRLERRHRLSEQSDAWMVQTSAAATRAVAGSGLTRIRDRLELSSGFSFRPLD